MTPLDRLHAHSREFDRKIYDLAPGMWLAVGYAASNVGVIEGEDGLIVIDTTESTAAAETILADLRARTAKPVTTILYTHSHRDHISGATVFAEGRDVEIIAHHAFDSDLVAREGRPGPGKALMVRTRRQFGIGLEFGTERVNLGLGPGDRPLKGLGAGHIAPNMLIETDGTMLTRGGVRMQLIFAPGECADTMAIWLPDHKVLFPGDNYYHSFPNLYAIRGTPYREFDLWADSLATLAALGAEVLAPGHSRPVMGAAEIANRLGDYEAAIRHTIAATAQGMNQGLGPDELAATIQLPDELATKPYLQEFYGALAWSVRAYFAGTLGWFSGDPADLNPLPPLAEAECFAALAGGPDALAQAVLDAAAKGDAQWVLELSGRALRLMPERADIRAARIAALKTLADCTENATARNYYLSVAQEDQ